MPKGSAFRGRRPPALLAMVVLASGLDACRHSASPTQDTAVTPEAPPTAAPYPPPLPPCPLPPGGGSGDHCPYELPNFALQVNEAIATVENEHPELFDLTQHLGGLSYFVKEPDRFTAGVAYVLSSRGFCAIWDGEELAVKNTNAFNEQYKILTSESFVRWGGGAYQSTCYPAWF